MGEVHFMISEAAKRVNVETHVLRYWEEELELTIGRTEMGHRYYTEEDIQLFNCIKELKEQGMLLKDLKGIIPDMLRTRERLRVQNAQKKEREKQLEQQTNIHIAKPAEKQIDTDSLIKEEVPPLTPMQEALRENNKILENSISLAVSKAVITEMDFLLQAKDRQEEDRYKKLDTLIRQQQTLRKDSVKSTPLKNLRRLFEM